MAMWALMIWLAGIPAIVMYMWLENQWRMANGKTSYPENSEDVIAMGIMTFAWPLVAVLAVIGFGLYFAGKYTKIGVQKFWTKPWLFKSRVKKPCTRAEQTRKARQVSDW